jgi:hypothetical protein
LQPILKGWHSRRRQVQLPRLSALASPHPQFAADQVQIGDVNRDGLGAAQAAAVGQSQEGGIAATTGGRIRPPPVQRSARAGVEETAEFSGREVATATFRLPAHGWHVYRRLILLGRHQLRLPALSQHAT